jgi:hypothetical protein
MDRTHRLRACARWYRRTAGLLCALLAGAAAVRAEITFQTRQDVAVGSSPTAVTLLPTTPPTLLVANGAGLSAFRYEDGGLESGPRSFEGRGAQLLVTGPLGPAGGAAVAYGSREAARIAVAPVDAQGSIGRAELIELPALPRAARIAALGAGLPAALLVGHDDGISVLTRSGAGWQRRELAAPRFGRDFELGDLDGDGRADLVVADEGTSQLSVLRGSGDGGFAAGEALATVRGLKRLLLADVNGDQRSDVLVVGDSGLAVHAAQPDGGLSAPQSVYPDAQLVDAAVADVNADGRPDLALLDRSRSTLTFLLGGEQGGFVVGDS